MYSIFVDKGEVERELLKDLEMFFRQEKSLVVPGEKVVVREPYR